MIAKTALKNSLRNNLTIKVASLIIGYSIWSFFSQSYTVHEWITLPVGFYNVQNKIVKTAPEFLKIKLAGKRSDLALCKNIAFHIDAQSLTSQEQLIMPNETSLFLPSSVKLLYCSPLKVSVQS